MYGRWAQRHDSSGNRSPTNTSRSGTSTAREYDKPMRGLDNSCCPDPWYRHDSQQEAQQYAYRQDDHHDAHQNAYRRKSEQTTLLASLKTMVSPRKELPEPGTLNPAVARAVQCLVSGMRKISYFSFEVTLRGGQIRKLKRRFPRICRREGPAWNASQPSCPHVRPSHPHDNRNHNHGGHCASAFVVPLYLSLSFDMFPHLALTNIRFVVSLSKSYSYKAFFRFRRSNCQGV